MPQVNLGAKASAFHTQHGLPSVFYCIHMRNACLSLRCLLQKERCVWVRTVSCPHVRQRVRPAAATCKRLPQCAASRTDQQNWRIQTSESTSDVNPRRQATITLPLWGFCANQEVSRNGLSTVIFPFSFSLRVSGKTQKYSVLWRIWCQIVTRRTIRIENTNESSKRGEKCWRSLVNRVNHVAGCRHCPASYMECPYRLIRSTTSQHKRPYESSKLEESPSNLFSKILRAKPAILQRWTPPPWLHLLVLVGLERKRENPLKSSQTKTHKEALVH